MEMKSRIENIIAGSYESTGAELRAVFNSQLQTFSNNPAIVSVIFAENIFHFNKILSAKVIEIMELMQGYVLENITAGQGCGQYKETINAKTLTTIITGSMRMAVLKWKLTGHKSNLVKDGSNVLEGVLKMIEN